MTSKQKEERLAQIENAIKLIGDKKCHVYFMTIDTKGNPNGSIEYIYTLAYGLKEKGYDVTMLHQEKEFIGVGEWMGEKYANLPHYNIETNNVEISVSDFIFVPEFLVTTLGQMKKLHCKKVGVVSNRYYLTDIMPFTAAWSELDVRDVITNTTANAEFLKTYFPYLRVHVVKPLIAPCFRKVQKLQTPTVNIIAKTPTEVNYAMKTFYWKYPQYGWVSFKDLRGFPQETMASMLQESAVTVWMDRDTNFGYPALEAARCGSLVVGLIPNEPKEWMLDKDNDKAFSNNIIWAENLDDVCDLVASIIDKWIRDEVPAEAYENQDKLAELYTPEEFSFNLMNVEKEIFETRKQNFQEVYGQLSAAPVNDNEENTTE